MTHRAYLVCGLVAAAIFVAKTSQALALDCVDDGDCEVGFECEATGERECQAKCGPYDFNCTPAECDPKTQRSCVPRACTSDVDCGVPGGCSANDVDAASVAADAGADAAPPNSAQQTPADGTIPMGFDAAATDLDAEARLARPGTVGCAVTTAGHEPAFRGWLTSLAALALVFRRRFLM